MGRGAIMTWNVLQGDVLTYLRGNQWMAQNGFIPKAHAVLCDPPYALPGGFMSKDWDNFNTPQAFESWVEAWAALLLDYVYPGALLMAFGGTRSYHRLAAGIEQAGWEIADCISWNYASGFPKSLNIEKATGDPKWRGYGSATKPAWEPCVVARAPRGKRTYAGLAREFGTGALAIDAARIGTEENTARANSGAKGNGNLYGASVKYDSVASPFGRWPANFALVCTCESDDHAADCPVAVLGAQTSDRTMKPTGGGETRGASTHTFTGLGSSATNNPDDTGGSAARFFYTAKAAAWERIAGLSARSTHPTHKPIRLAEYLARLILPPEGDEPRRLLVPFAGSGSEMIGALLAGWDDVTGIEREAEYVAIARARVAWWAQFATYDAARSAYERERKARTVIIPAPVVVEDKPTQIALFEEASA
jgi:DNA modification methylase